MRIEACKHLYFRDGIDTRGHYEVIRMCDGKNRLKAEAGMIRWKRLWRMKVNPNPFLPKTLPPTTMRLKWTRISPSSGPPSYAPHTNNNSPFHEDGNRANFY
jgi:hypothetical protein